jgi:uncharacterized membrane protein YjgN (DUF898 family)
LLVSGISQNDIHARTAELKRQEQAYQGRHATVMVNQAPVYDGRLRELFSLVLVNFLLNVITAGFFRFWAKTRLRRYFLSRVSFLDDRLIYTGTGKELFIGFLVILAVLVPVFIGFELLKGYAFGQGMIVFTFAQVVYYGSIMFLVFAAVYRAQRYRLSRITWRGIRGGQAGSAFAYAIRAMGWSAAVLVTVGLAYPLMRTDLMAYRINNARFGQQGFWFTGSAGPLFAYWMLPWISLLVLAGSVIALVGLVGTANLTEGFENMTTEDKAALGKTMPIWSPVVYGAIGLFFIASFWYRAAEVRHFTGHTTFGNLAFESRLTGFKLLLPYLAYGFLLSLVIGGVIALLAAGIYSFDGSVLDSENETTFTIFVFGAVIVLFGMGSLFKPLIVQNFLIRVFCNSLTIKGRIESDKLLQSQMKAPQRGEGLADALDIDGF